MMIRALLILLITGGSITIAQDDLPMRESREPLEFEPQLILPEVEANDSIPTAPPPDVGKAQTALERAKRKDERWQKLARSGVLSKVEVESAAIQVARASANYQNALLAQRRSEVELLR